MSTHTKHSAYAAAAPAPATHTTASVDVDIVIDRFRTEWREDPEHDRWWWWPRSIRVDPNELIVDDDQGHLYALPFETDGENAVTFGEPVQVRETYVPVTTATRTTAMAAIGRRKQSAVTSFSKPQYPPKPGNAPATKTPEETTSVTPEEIREALGLTADATDEQVRERMAAGQAALDADDAPTGDVAGTTPDAPAATTAAPATTTSTAPAPAAAATADVTAAARVAAADAVQRELIRRDEDAAKTAAFEAKRDEYLEAKVADGSFHRDAKAAFALSMPNETAFEAAKAEIDKLTPGVVPLLQRRPKQGAPSTAASAATDPGKMSRLKAQAGLGASR